MGTEKADEVPGPGERGSQQGAHAPRSGTAEHWSETEHFFAEQDAESAEGRRRFSEQMERMRNRTDYP